VEGNRRMRKKYAGSRNVVNLMVGELVAAVVILRYPCAVLGQAALLRPRPAQPNGRFARLFAEINATAIEK